MKHPKATDETLRFNYCNIKIQQLQHPGSAIAKLVSPVTEISAEAAAWCRCLACLSTIETLLLAPYPLGARRPSRVAASHSALAHFPLGARRPSRVAASRGLPRGAHCPRVGCPRRVRHQPLRANTSRGRSRRACRPSLVARMGHATAPHAPLLPATTLAPGCRDVTTGEMSGREAMKKIGGLERIRTSVSCGLKWAR